MLQKDSMADKGYDQASIAFKAGKLTQGIFTGK